MPFETVNSVSYTSESAAARATGKKKLLGAE